jgi:hypothetical protein
MVMRARSTYATIEEEHSPSPCIAAGRMYHIIVTFAALQHLLQTQTNSELNQR